MFKGWHWIFFNSLCRQNNYIFDNYFCVSLIFFSCFINLWNTLRYAVGPSWWWEEEGLWQAWRGRAEKYATRRWWWFWSFFKVNCFVWWRKILFFFSWAWHNDRISLFWKEWYLGPVIVGSVLQCSSIKSQSTKGFFISSVLFLYSLTKLKTYLILFSSYCLLLFFWFEFSLLFHISPYYQFFLKVINIYNLLLLLRKDLWIVNKIIS